MTNERAPMAGAYHVAASATQLPSPPVVSAPAAAAATEPPSPHGGDNEQQHAEGETRGDGDGDGSGSGAVPAGWEVLSQGAEARVFGLTLLGRPAVAKQRFRKRSGDLVLFLPPVQCERGLTQWAAGVKMCVTARYRLAELDERLTVQRVTAEARCVARCRRAGVPAPALLLLDARQRTLYLEVAIGHLEVLGGNLGVTWR